MDIAIIGAGKVGGALGARWAALGHRIHIGPRTPEEPNHDLLRTPPSLPVETAPEAPARGQGIVLATPWAAAQDAVRGLGPLGEKPVSDTTNPVGFSAEGVVMTPIDGPSGAALIAAAANGGRVVKTLNQVGFNIMIAPSQGAAPALMFVAGDSAEAKTVVAGLVRELGFDAQDAGPLRNAAALEHLALLWIDHAMRGPHGRDFALSLTPVPPHQA